MFRLILWSVLLLLVIRVAWRFVYSIFEAAGMLKEPQGRDTTAVKLVRDPVCGVFVLPAKALTAGSGAATQYFCSEKCRQQWGRR